MSSTPTTDDVYDSFGGLQIVRLWERLRHWMNSNTKEQAKKNISYHYDLGNEFYGLWLDDTMTYSSAIFETGQESLENAQTLKYKSMVDQMGVQPGDHVLEIGCGWGGFAEYAARERGLRVTGLTISNEQRDYALARMERAGIADKVDIKLQDYRDERASMTASPRSRCSRPSAKSSGRSIRHRARPSEARKKRHASDHHHRGQTVRHVPQGVDFIQKYIFPGGMLPSPTVLRSRSTKRPARHEIHRIRRKLQPDAPGAGTMFSMCAGTTYRCSDSTIASEECGFLLTSCAAGFHAGSIDVTQITVTKPG